MLGRLFSGRGLETSHCSGYSHCGARTLAGLGFRSCSTQALEHSLVACGIFPDPGLNLCLLHWQAGSTTEPSGKPQHLFLTSPSGEFPGGLVVRVQRFHCRGSSSFPGQGTEIPQATCCDKSPSGCRIQNRLEAGLKAKAQKPGRRIQARHDDGFDQQWKW